MTCRRWFPSDEERVQRSSSQIIDLSRGIPQPRVGCLCRQRNPCAHWCMDYIMHGSTGGGENPSKLCYGWHASAHHVQIGNLLTNSLQEVSKKSCSMWSRCITMLHVVSPLFHQKRPPRNHASSCSQLQWLALSLGLVRTFVWVLTNVMVSMHWSWHSRF